MVDSPSEMLCRELPEIANRVYQLIHTAPGFPLTMDRMEKVDAAWFAEARTRMEQAAITVTVSIPQSEHHVCRTCQGRSIVARERTLRASDEATLTEFVCTDCAKTWLE